MKRTHRVFGDMDALQFVDDRLDDDRRAAYEAYLATDPESAARVQLWTRQNEFIRTAFAASPQDPLPLWLRLNQLEPERDNTPASAASVERLPRARPAKTEQPSPREAPQSSGGMKALAAASLLIAIGALSIIATHVILTLPRDGSEQAHPRVAAMTATGAADRAWDAFRTFALDQSHPVEVSASEQPLLERWLMRRLMIPIHAPDLSDMGWTFLGGRLTPSDTGAAAFLVYQDATIAHARLGLFIGRANGLGDREPVAAPTTSGSTLSWVSGSVAYVVAAEKDTKWMVQNAGRLHAHVYEAEAN